MNNSKPSFCKSILIFTLSVVFTTLGIVCIAWSIFDVFKQLNYSDKKSLQVYPIERENATSSQVTLDKILYPTYPSEGDNIGSLTIPILNQTFSIFQGTDTDELKKGVGHFIQSVLPGEEDNCVLSGHRETVFREIYKLKIGDELIIQTSAGTFTYEVSGTRIVDKDDRTVIVPIDHAVLTMTTCYPFNPLASANSRYIVSADLIQKLSD